MKIILKNLMKYGGVLLTHTKPIDSAITITLFLHTFVRNFLKITDSYFVYYQRIKLDIFNSSQVGKPPRGIFRHTSLLSPGLVSFIYVDLQVGRYVIHISVLQVGELERTFLSIPPKQ